MKRFKLVQKYPGSPDKGTVVYSPHREQAYSDIKYKMKNEGSCHNHIFFSQEEIEDFPKFWKQI